jgi:hypothetical protein
VIANTRPAAVTLPVPPMARMIPRLQAAGDPLFESGNQNRL